MENIDDEGFERLARPLLELTHRISGLESTFVTQIDWAAQQQEVEYAVNTSDLEIPEGIVTAWPDTMCRTALLEGKEHSSDVPHDFPDNLAAKQLGLRSYFSLPILNGDAVIGTICGASRRSVNLDPDVVRNLRLISEAISYHMTSRVEAQALRRRAEQAEAEALSDSLTGLANRRGFAGRFEEELARSGRHHSAIAVLAIDLDDFKDANDTYGHLQGDVILVALADVLRDVARAEDVAARLGGDEFVLLLSQCDSAGAEAVAARIADDFARATRELDMPCTLSIGVSSSESCQRLELLGSADEALYRAKAKRGRTGPQAPAVVR